MPKRNTLIFTAAWILFWTLMTTVELQDYIRNGGQHYWQPVLWQCSSALVITLLSLVQRHIMRRYDVFLDRPLRWFALNMAWLPAYWLVFTLLVFGLRHAVYFMLNDRYTHSPWPQLFVYESIKLSLFFVIFVVILFGILSYQALLREKEQAMQSEALMRETQLHRLTQQIQPHFLFNALNTISQLMHVDVHKADAMLIQLADVLRATLAISEQHETTLANELQLARAYAQLMCERFADRVSISWNIETPSEACLVPVMSLQPLLENIFKHTVEQRRQKTNITVAARCAQGKLSLRIADDLGMLAAKQNKVQGIGLRNLRARLHTLHGDNASLTLTQLAPAGVRAEMSLPCAC
jgi:two-component system LytT family sensor kinase